MTKKQRVWEARARIAEWNRMADKEEQNRAKLSALRFCVYTGHMVYLHLMAHKLLVDTGYEVIDA